MYRVIFITFSFVILISFTTVSQNVSNAKTYIRQSKPTMTPIELNHGESLTYIRDDGEKLVIKLVETDATILYTNRDKIPRDESGNDRGNMYRARLLYEYTAEVKVNGQPMIMRRYVGSQESFFRPYVINGVRIWLIGVTDIFEEYGGFLNTARSANGMPHKNARFVLQDMEKRICPGELHAWYKDGENENANFIYKENFIDIGRCFNGADCFMGAYLGGESHGALDINMEQNSLMYAPFDLDTQNGIRAKGSKTWSDGSEWRINTGHIIKKNVPDGVPVEGGQVYGIGARRACWWHPHAHFGFQIVEQGVLYEIDPWIIFWQHFEDNKRKSGTLQAMMQPLKHCSTGEEIKVTVNSNVYQPENNNITAYWSFGDGGWANGKQVGHIYSKPGIYPVTLVTTDGNKRASFTQHVTVDGKRMDKPVIILDAPDEPSFQRRPVGAMDVYSWPVKIIPHTLEFFATPTRPKPNEKIVTVKNPGSGTLNPVSFSIDYQNDQYFEWVNIHVEGTGNDQKVHVRVDAKGIPAGIYHTIIGVHAQDAIHSPQKFRVAMEVSTQASTSKSVIVDDKDEGFYCTPYFWVGHRFHGWGWPELKNAEGYNNFYLMNGKRAKKGQFARFTPELAAGLYDVWLYERTPFASGPPANHEPAKFNVRVKHADGDTVVSMNPERMSGFFPRPYKGQKSWAWLEPQRSRKIGTFRFEEGKDGFVEIRAGASTGQVIADAVRFLKR